MLLINYTNHRGQWSHFQPWHSSDLLVGLNRISVTLKHMKRLSTTVTPTKKWELLVTLMKIQDLFYLWGCQRNRSFCILVVGMQWHYAGGCSNTLWDNKLKKCFILWLSNSTPRNVFYALTCINEEWHAQFFLIFFSFSFPPSLLLQFLSICGKGLWNCVNILFLNKLLIK